MARGRIRESSFPPTQIAMLGTVTLKMEATILNCSSCSQPLNPRRVYKCMDIHLVCHCYVRKITSCQKCEHPSGGFTHEPAMDVFLAAARVECAHKGCSSLLPYYELHEHEIMCRYTPCTCTETGYNFVAPLPELVAHLEAVHSIQVHNIQYATTKAFQELVTLSGEPSRQLIVVGEQDGVVYVLTIGSVSTVPLVSAVYVRATMGDLSMYRVRMWVECPPLLSWTDGRRRTSSMTVELDAPSSTKPYEVMFEDLTSYLAAPPHYLVGPATWKELRFFFRIEF